MSYAQNQHSRRGRAPAPRRRPFRLEEARPAAMGGFLDFFTAPVKDLLGVSSPDNSIDVGCKAAADRKTAALDAQVNDLAKTWKADNGIYKVADITRVRDQVMALLLDVSRALDQALIGATTEIKSSIRQAQSMLYAKEGDSLTYTKAINEANAKGVAVISAPDFKDWVIKSMNKASVGMGHATYVACIKPTSTSVIQAVLVAAVAVAQQSWDKLYATGKRLVKFVEELIDLVMATPKAALDILTYAKYGAAAFAAWWLYKKFKP